MSVNHVWAVYVFVCFSDLYPFLLAERERTQYAICQFIRAVMCNRGTNVNNDKLLIMKDHGGCYHMLVLGPVSAT